MDKKLSDDFPQGFRAQRIGVVAALAIADRAPRDIAMYFREHLETAKDLLQESYDKRFTPSSFITEEAEGFSVGWYSTRSGYECVKKFTDLAEAATDYLLFSLGKGRWVSSRGTNFKLRQYRYNPSHHWFAVFVACATFCLLIAGALVTSNDAGLSIPDWPTSFGSFNVPPWHGGVQYEWSHRVIAFSTGLLTIGIATWTWISDSRRWMKGLALGALATIIAQGILGGLTVLYFQPPMVSSAHAAVAQTFFCIACAIALFTSRDWMEETPQLESESHHPRLLTLSFLSIVVLYLQLILGAMFRHHGMGWLPHVLNAPVVAIVITWTAVRALSRYSKIDAIRRPAIAMLSLLLAQLFLGFLAFMTRVEWGKNAAQPELPMVISTVAHVVTGALLLASTVILTIQVWRHIPSGAKSVISHADRKIVAA